MTLRAALISREQRPGSFKVAYTMSGKLHLRFSGSMESVRLRPTFYLTPLDAFYVQLARGRAFYGLCSLSSLEFLSVKDD